MTSAADATGAVEVPSAGWDGGALLEVTGLRVQFAVRPDVLGRPRARVHAVDGVDLTVRRGETLGLVGESGSGKSTLGRAILRLVPVHEGRVVFDGVDLTALAPRRLRALRRRMHMIFQDPYSSLDPSYRIEDVVAEPLDVHGGVGGRERRDRVVAALERVGLGAHHLRRRPHEFSGGQRQRVAIARALISRPELVVCDEAVSALDVSTKGQVVNLLRDLQEEFGLTYVFIAHDLAVVRHISTRIAVLYLGRLVEDGPAERVYERPAHPYTASLLSAIPRPDPKRRGEPRRIVLRGDLPSPLDPPSGCRFHPRCPFAMDVCRVETPPTTPVRGGGQVACHLHVSGPRLDGGSVFDLLDGDGGDARTDARPVTSTRRPG